MNINARTYAHKNIFCFSNKKKEIIEKINHARNNEPKMQKAN
jgi:hypothetical protein